METTPSQARRTCLIYGATGYTGEKIAAKAVLLGMQVVLAGRSETVRALAARLDLACLVFSLEDAAATRRGLDGVHVVIHCAGPFSATAAPMIEACLATGVHYLDITGEIGVFELAAGRNADARQRNVVLCPGVGFDVVPTDCLAASLHAALPDATHLALGFDSDSPLSPGTAKTMVEGLARGGQIRRDGRITDVPFAYKTRRIDFGRGEKIAMTIPWGDVSTAFHTTGIANIECFVPCPPAIVRWSGLINWLRPVFGMGLVQRALKRLIERKVHGPSDRQLATQSTSVWGEVRNARGDVRVGRLTTANGYALTVDSALAVARHLLEQPTVAGGFTTPARLCGASLVEQLPGSSAIRISPA